MFKSVQVKWDQWVSIRVETGRGAMVCLLPTLIARQAGMDPPTRKYRISLENGGVRKMLGEMGVLRIDGKESSTVILVSDEVAKPLLGMDALEFLGAKTMMARGKIRAAR